MLLKSIKEHPCVPRACEAERSVFDLLLLVYGSLDWLGVVVQSFEEIVEVDLKLIHGFGSSA